MKCNAKESTKKKELQMMLSCFFGEEKKTQQSTSQNLTFPTLKMTLANNNNNSKKAAKANSPKIVEWDMVSDYVKELLIKLRDPDSYNLKPNEMYESRDAFIESGLTLPQFCSNMNRIKVRIGKFVQDADHKFEYGTLFLLSLL